MRYDEMSTKQLALAGSVNRLRDLAEPLDSAQLRSRAYPNQWTIADVLSHVGSGAVIMQRRLDDALAGRETDDGFAPSVWDVWNAKSPEAKVADALDADRALVERIESLSDDERDRLRFSMGPMSVDFEGFIEMRLSEHALHTWDVEVALDPQATLHDDATALVVDRLEMIARYSGKPSGTVHDVIVRTSNPTRDFRIALGADSVSLTPGASSAAPDLELPAEALIRLVYGRLDPDHSPAVADPALLDELRSVFPGI
jgi:uncharacterized protein (TIGR03083 family)